MANKKKKKKVAPRPGPRPASRPAPRGTTFRGAPAPAGRRRRRPQNRRVLLWAALVLLAIVAGVCINDNRQEDRAARRALTGGSCELDSRSDRTDPAGRNHIENPTYRVNPPAGGNHSPSAASPGVYAGADVPPDGQLVHSLEHGYVVIWHKPGLPETQMRVIEAVFDRYERDVLVVERASLPQPVAATAWGKRLLCEAPERGALTTFVQRYRNQGPEKVPH